MTRSQLTYLYAFANLPYSEELEALEELKKIVLLELKVKPSILIGGKEWNKNDILSFFNSSIDQSFDYETFISDYPWIEKLKNPSAITYESNLLSVDFTDKRFQQFASNESEQYEDEFLRTLRSYLKENQDYYAAALLLYKQCFTSTFQLRLENEIKTMLTYRFNQIIALSSTVPQKELMNKHAVFFRRTGFYKLMKEITVDSEFMNLNLEALSVAIHNSNALHQIKEIVNNQLTLTHSQEGLVFLNDLKRQVKNEKPLPKSSSSALLKSIYIVVVVVVVLVRILGMNSTPDYKIDYQQIQKFQENIRNQQQEIIQRDSIETLIKTKLEQIDSLRIESNEN